MTDSSTQNCPLCRAAANHYFKTETRRFCHCPNCGLVFVPRDYFLSESEERSRYDLHQNDPSDPGYRDFLERIIDPIEKRIPESSNGLDFGSGPGPTLSLYFEERGHKMTIYDPFYAPDKAALNVQYDFVTATEVVEHLYTPWQTLCRMWACVKPGGCLGVMTQPVESREQFAHWHYKNDQTHVCFFAKETLEWLATKWQTNPIFEAGVVIFEKPRGPSIP